MVDPVDDLNDLLDSLSLNERRTAVLEGIIQRCGLDYKMTRKTANKRVKQNKIQVCLKCFVFYASHVDLRSHVHEEKHATGPRITKAYQKANDAYKADPLNEENQKRRLFALTKAVCLQKIGKGGGAR
jgi:hypothetical protein